MSSQNDVLHAVANEVPKIVDTNSVESKFSPGGDAVDMVVALSGQSFELGQGVGYLTLG